jgi:hypothetical protein
MKRDAATWHRVFERSLVGVTPYVQSKADADEYVQRAKMLADRASVVAGEVPRTGSLPESSEENDPFPLTRQFLRSRTPEPAPIPGPFDWEGDRFG